MRLTLVIGGKVLASVPLDAEKAGRHDYLQAKKRLLQAVYYSEISRQNKPPLYYIEVGSKMNKEHKPRRVKEPA